MVDIKYDPYPPKSDILYAYPGWIVGQLPDRLQHGMTLRDYFAAAALAGLSTEGSSASAKAKCAYIIADEMLKERDGNGTPD